MTDSNSTPNNKKPPSLYGKSITLRKGDQLAGLCRVLERVGGPRDITPKHWQVLSGMYRGLRAETDPPLWGASWSDAKKLRKGLITESQASELARALTVYELYFVEARKRWAVATGYNKRRHAKLRAQNPEAYKRKATERQRRHRARLKAAKATAEIALSQIQPTNDVAPEAQAL